MKSLMVKVLYNLSFILFLASLSAEASGTARVSSQKFKAQAMKSSRLKHTKVAQYRSSETLSQSVMSAHLSPQDDGVFSGVLNASHSQSMVDRQDGSREATQTLLLIMNTRLNSTWTLTNRLSITQDLRDQESLDDGFSDLLFILSRQPTPLSGWLLGSPTFIGVLPAAERTTQVQNLKTSLQAGYNFIINPDVLQKGFTLSLNTTVLRNFHAYDTDKAGNVLNEYGLRETLSAGYTKGPWALSADFIFRHGLNYRGNWVQTFEHSQELAYSIMKSWSVSLGHTNSGAWLAPNGQESNFKLINEDDSLFYVSSSLMF